MALCTNVRPRKRPLTSSELLHIELGISDSNTVMDALLAALSAVSEAFLTEQRLSMADFSPENPIPLRLFSIPDFQNEQVIRMLLERCRQLELATTGVHVALEWAHLGPDTYRPENQVAR